MVLQYNLIVSEIALKEFDDSFYYYKNQKIGLETEFAECINNSFITICINPFAFQKVAKQIRHFVVDKFPFIFSTLAKLKKNLKSNKSQFRQKNLWQA